MEELKEMLKESKFTTAFTGAGVSTFSGIRDFRGKNGLYHDPEYSKIFDIDYFVKDPSFYYRKSKDFIYDMDTKHPGIVHNMLVGLEKKDQLKAVITQNIDLLHQKAGSTDVIELHGTATLHHCMSCGKEFVYTEISEMVLKDEVPYCDKCSGIVKPDITFFGEGLPEIAINRGFSLAEQSQLMIVLGTSLTVQPAASIPMVTVEKGGRIVIVNDMETPLDRYAWKRFYDLESFSEELLN